LSQHNITINSPLLGSVQLTAGFDPRLKELFVNYVSDDDSFMSSPGLQLQDIARIVHEQLQIELPQQIIKGIEQDVLDFEQGATNVGRRISCYSADGALVSAITF
jgi:hypothetical protein